MIDKVFKWIFIYAVLTVGILMLLAFNGADIYFILLFLLLLNIIALLTMAGLFASYLYEKENEN
ncbi:hypothetical protein SD71_15040 [Cohnella kolymensis]|uniref:Uncharacterized protein n=1 Tax=Cohnella kolymensis TaxID=1590652 RepID=A0ABR5A1R6_9BACL|nr:hypothetical protein SD71_15040 [Cohnella kolymensis]